MDKQIIEIQNKLLESLLIFLPKEIILSIISEYTKQYGEIYEKEILCEDIDCDHELWYEQIIFYNEGGYTWSPLCLSYITVIDDAVLLHNQTYILDITAVITDPKNKKGTLIHPYDIDKIIKESKSHYGVNLDSIYFDEFIV